MIYSDLLQQHYLIILAYNYRNKITNGYLVIIIYRKPKKLITKNKALKLLLNNGYLIVKTYTAKIKLDEYKEELQKIINSVSKIYSNKIIYNESRNELH